MIVNALCTADFARAAERCDRLIAAGGGQGAADFYATFDGTGTCGNVYLPSMAVDESMLEAFFDHVVSNDCRAIVRAAYSLEEVGLINVRYRLSPIMLLHKMGVMDKCTVASGVCLDNDDIDLMVQEGVPLVLLPTADAGYGNGFAPVCAAVRRGLRVGVGTFDGKYNSEHSVSRELDFLRLTANAAMNAENALTKEQLGRIARFA